MRRLALFLLLAAVPATADAKSPKKMSDAELLDELKGGEKASLRANAAEELGARRLQSAAGDLGMVCGDDPEVEVCDAAMDALLQLNSSDAWDAVQGIFERPSASAASRRRALSVLLDKSPALFDDSAPRVMAVYRGLDPALASDLFVAIKDRNLTGLSDAVMFAALDSKYNREARLVALATAESFDHPRLYEAYVAFLGDHDREVRVHACEGLNEPGLPGSVVVPALLEHGQNDPEGSVRSACMDALRNYTHTDMLSLIHDRIVHDSHPYAWDSALALLVILADESSLKPMYEVLDKKTSLKADKLTLLVDLIASMKAESSLGPLRALEQRHQGSALAEHIREVLPLIEDDYSTIDRPKPTVDFEVWVPGEEDPRVPALTVSMGSNDTLTGI
jgi:hypothetical protein